MFYTYYQNNSGGFFEHGEDVTNFVIVEAGDNEAANEFAESIGIYFDGCDRRIDCTCCGDRWERQLQFDGEDEPLIYGENVATWNSWFKQPGQPYAYVYSKDGTKQTFQEGE